MYHFGVMFKNSSVNMGNLKFYRKYHRFHVEWRVFTRHDPRTCFVSHFDLKEWPDPMSRVSYSPYIECFCLKLQSSGWGGRSGHRFVLFLSRVDEGGNHGRSSNLLRSVTGFVLESGTGVEISIMIINFGQRWEKREFSKSLEVPSEWTRKGFLSKIHIILKGTIKPLTHIYI